MKKVILDTNVLMLPGQKMFDVFGELERVMQEPYVLVVLDQTINELAKLAAGKSKDAQAARLGLALVNAQKAANPTIWEKILGLVPNDKKARKLLVVATKKYADDAIVDYADKDTIVATLDRELKSRLKKKKISILSVKGKSFTFS